MQHIQNECIQHTWCTTMLRMQNATPDPPDRQMTRGTEHKTVHVAANGHPVADHRVASHLQCFVAPPRSLPSANVMEARQLPANCWTKTHIWTRPIVACYLIVTPCHTRRMSCHPKSDVAPSQIVIHCMSHACACLLSLECNAHTLSPVHINMPRAFCRSTRRVFTCLSISSIDSPNTVHYC